MFKDQLELLAVAILIRLDGPARVALFFALFIHIGEHMDYGLKVHTHTHTRTHTHQTSTHSLRQYVSHSIFPSVQKQNISIFHNKIELNMLPLLFPLCKFISLFVRCEPASASVCVCAFEGVSELCP
jgi:hypothetical protein